MNIFKMLMAVVLLNGIVFAEDYKYILHDSCINSLYNPAVNYFENTNVYVYRVPQGIVLSFKLINPENDINSLSERTRDQLIKIEYFLAKIKNPAIIEVHVGDFPKEEFKELKKWEISTVIANKIELFYIQSGEKINQNRIHSVGYGEFLPPKNTPYNGGNYSNRVDIIVLCNIIGD